MAKRVKILCVCGSGTVSSSMVANKLKEKLADHGYDAETALAAGGFSLMACVSPVYEDFGIPKVNAVGMLTGLSEDQVLEDCLKILNAE